MHHDLKHRIQAMRDKLEGRAPVAEIQGSSQLFVTPSPECRRLVELADVRETDRILEPSAGTGAILRAIRDAVPRAKCDAVELHAGLARHLRGAFPGGPDLVRRFSRISSGAPVYPNYHESAVSSR